MACRLNGAKSFSNQCWNIVNWTLGNKFQWNFNQNWNIFIEENTFENVVCEMLFISSRPQCVNAEETGHWVSFKMFYCKFWSCEICVQECCIVLKFEWCLSSSAAEMPIQFQNDTIVQITNRLVSNTFCNKTRSSDKKNFKISHFSILVIWFRRKLCPNPLAQLAVLFALGH